MPVTPVTTSQSGDGRNILNINKKDDKENGITPDRLLHMTAQTDLRWGCDSNLANRICNYGNRYYMEHAGYFLTTSFLAEIRIEKIKDLTFFDSNTGLPLFLAPRGRTMDDFLTESRNFGWLRFRTEEVLWNNVHLNESCGELVSKDGTHLGHVLPDPETHEPRYMINIVSIAGRPTNSLVEV